MKLDGGSNKLLMWDIKSSKIVFWTIWHVKLNLKNWVGHPKNIQNLEDLQSKLEGGPGHVLKGEWKYGIVSKATADVAVN